MSADPDNRLTPELRAAIEQAVNCSYDCGARDLGISNSSIVEARLALVEAIEEAIEHAWAASKRVWW